MIILDVNVLVAAYLTGHQYHDAARAFLDESLKTGEVGIPDVVWSGFIRTVTNPAVVQPPAALEEVNSFIAAVRRHRGYLPEVRSMVSPLESFVRLCQTSGARGNKVSDAYIACVAIDYNAAVATWDSDFNAFPPAVIHPHIAESPNSVAKNVRGAP